MKEKITNALKDVNTICKIGDSQAVVYWNGFHFGQGTLEFFLRQANINFAVKGRTVENGHVLTWYNCNGYEVVFIY